MNLERMPKAYQQGYSAYQWGDPAHRCPYGKAFELRQRTEWFAGYWGRRNRNERIQRCQ